MLLSPEAGRPQIGQPPVHHTLQPTVVCWTCREPEFGLNLAYAREYRVAFNLGLWMMVYALGRLTASPDDTRQP